MKSQIIFVVGLLIVLMWAAISIYTDPKNKTIEQDLHTYPQTFYFLNTCIERGIKIRQVFINDKEVPFEGYPCPTN